MLRRPLIIGLSIVAVFISALLVFFTWRYLTKSRRSWPWHGAKGERLPGEQDPESPSQSKTERILLEKEVRHLSPYYMFEDKQTQDASERPSSRTSYQQERAIEIHLRMLNEDPNITPELVLRTADSIELIPSTNLSPTNRNSNHKKSTEDHGISDQTPSSSNEKPPCQLTVKSKLGGNLKVINSASPHRIVNACNVSPRPRKKEILASNKVDLDDFGDSATFYPKDGDYRVFPDSQVPNKPKHTTSFKTTKHVRTSKTTPTLTPTTRTTTTTPPPTPTTTPPTTTPPTTPSIATPPTTLDLDLNHVNESLSLHTFLGTPTSLRSSDPPNGPLPSLPTHSTPFTKRHRRLAGLVTEEKNDIH